MVRFPLLARILLWFTLNLIFLAAVFYVFASVQFRLGLDTLLGGRAGDPIQNVARAIASELEGKTHGQWNDLLRNFSDAYHVQFALFRNDGAQIAGENLTLPGDVLQKFRTPAPGRAPRGGGPDGPALLEPGAGFPPERGPGPPGGPGPWPPPGAGPEGRPPHLREPNPGGPAPPPRFMVHTSKPGRYWVGVRLPHGEGSRLGPFPVTLLAVSDSIRGGGLFVDFVPWVVVGFGAVLVSVLFWVPLVRGITRSISQMTSATEQIAQGRFEARVAGARRDELGRLGQAINQMAARLGGFVSGQKRFLGDIAHELCSPIARIQVALGILEQRADAKQKTYVEDLREEVQQMSDLVNELLSFSKASLEPAAIQLQPVSVLQTVEQAVRRESAPGTRICVDADPELLAQADPELLLRSIANLLRNAIRYAGEAGPITVSAAREAGQVRITVADCGPGVPEESLAQLFDPFYRTEPSRTRETGGVGLGLAIVKTCVESCQGNVRCRNRQPSGLEVVILLRPA